VIYRQPALVIPAYQPDEQLLALIRAFREQRPFQMIIVVNDGSGPHTRTLFAALLAYRVEVLHHPRNFGKGQALKTAFAHYLNMVGDQAVGVITADADGQHSVEDIIAVSDALMTTAYDLHLGVRDFNGETLEIPWRSKFGNFLTSYIFRKMSATALCDTQTGLRGIPVSLLQSLLSSPLQGYELEMEMLLIAVERQIRMNQIPIKTIYLNNNAKSHFNPLLDSVRIYRVVVRFFWQVFKKRRSAS
jgi:glycosyltransferase involved in cell wall biosynthesis